MMEERRQSTSERVRNITLPVLSVKSIQQLDKRPQHKTAERQHNGISQKNRRNILRFILNR